MFVHKRSFGPGASEALPVLSGWVPQSLDGYETLANQSVDICGPSGQFSLTS